MTCATPAAAESTKSNISRSSLVATVPSCMVTAVSACRTEGTEDSALSQSTLAAGKRVIRSVSLKAKCTTAAALTSAGRPSRYASKAKKP
eukprot:9449369-Lingulodinium_polyedra.AAC.1